jgi:hypothetical protein
LEQAYPLLSKKVEYKDLTAAHFDTIEPERHARQLVKRLERPGYKVSLEHAA